MRTVEVLKPGIPRAGSPMPLHKQFPKEFNCWAQIKQRCLNPNAQAWPWTGGKGIKIAGVLRDAISADLVVRVNAAGVELGTLTIPAATAIKTKVETPITDKTLVEGTIITWDIVSSDSSRDTNSIASITVEWGSVTQVTIMGQWRNDWDPSADYALGDTVAFDGSSYISLQDGNTANDPLSSPAFTPDPGGTAFWDLVALRGSPGIAGTGVPAGGTTGQVLTKASNADFDTDWEDIPQVLTTKGDLETVELAGSPAASTVVRFPVAVLAPSSCPFAAVPRLDAAASTCRSSVAVG